MPHHRFRLGSSGGRTDGSCQVSHAHSAQSQSRTRPAPLEGGGGTAAVVRCHHVVQRAEFPRLRLLERPRPVQGPDRARVVVTCPGNVTCANETIQLYDFYDAPSEVYKSAFSTRRDVRRWDHVFGGGPGQVFGCSPSPPTRKRRRRCRRWALCSMDCPLTRLSSTPSGPLGCRLSVCSS